jgi:hypothetical protein
MTRRWFLLRWRWFVSALKLVYWRAETVRFMCKCAVVDVLVVLIVNAPLPFDAKMAALRAFHT